MPGLGKHQKDHEKLEVLDKDENDVRYLQLDQTTPQTIKNGAPVFEKGLVIKAGERIYFDG